MKTTDVILTLGLSLLLATYAHRLDTRQSRAMVAGYAFLASAKYLSLSRGEKDDTVKMMKKIGYVILCVSPSFEHWHDVFALVGYTYCFFADYDSSVAPLAIYYILGAEATTSVPSKVARSLLGFGVMMGFKSPLQ